MKTVLIVDSAQERDISFDFGLDKRLYLRVSVLTAKAARVALNTVQFDMALVGDVPDVKDPLILLKELQQVVPEVLPIHGAIASTPIAERSPPHSLSYAFDTSPGKSEQVDAGSAQGGHAPALRSVR